MFEFPYPPPSWWKTWIPLETRKDESEKFDTVFVSRPIHQNLLISFSDIHHFEGVLQTDVFVFVFVLFFDFVFVFVIVNDFVIVIVIVIVVVFIIVILFGHAMSPHHSECSNP